MSRTAPGSIDHGYELVAQGKAAQARTIAARVLAKSPRDPGALSLMSTACVKLGEAAQGIYYAQRCVEVIPEDVRAHVNLARAMLDAGRPADAADHLERIIPSVAAEERVYTLLSHARSILGRPAEAAEWAARGLALFPDSVPLLINRAASALICGDAAESVRCCRRAREIDPRHPGALSHLLSSLNYADLDVQQAATETHAMYGRLMAELHGPAMFDWRVSPEPERPLRVGLLTPDLREHAVSYFAEPVLRHHDRSRWTLYAYSTANPEDARTAELKQLVAQWRPISGMRYAQVAERIKQDRIDVLIDLAGHTNGNALPVLHLKPAPVQMTWIGYPHSTGVPSVDYRIVDSITDPPESTGAPWRCVEQPLALDPCFITWQPPEGIPAPAPEPPQLRSGVVTFGTFAALQKCSEATVRLWAGVLAAVPGSRLLYKTTALKTEPVRAMVLDRLVKAGVDPARLDLEPPGVGAREMMPNYARMDVSLDTFPYHGTTTTCECLWMGVPMVTLEGPPGVPAARVSCSIIRAVAGDDADRMIASDENGYIARAADLARDAATLTRWRGDGPGGLREMMRRSAVGDGPSACRRLESAVQEAWRTWCSGRAGS